MFVRKIILAVVWNLATYGGVLFASAGTIHWWRAWGSLGLILIATLATMVGVFRTRPDLLRERMKGLVQKGQPMIDRVLVISFVIAYTATIAFTARDVFHYHVFPKPPLWVSSLGLVLSMIGWLIISLVFKENAFAAPVVRHQAEREHKVVDTGVYAMVRHPMYAGIFLFIVGMTLWLESYAAALLTIVPIGILAIRIVFEERFLRRELPGYEAYSEKVRWRLVPFVW